MLLGIGLIIAGIVGYVVRSRRKERLDITDDASLTDRQRNLYSRSYAAARWTSGLLVVAGVTIALIDAMRRL
jgi:hypothetical protein